MRTRSKILAIEILKWEGSEVKFAYRVSGSLHTLTYRLVQFLKRHYLPQTLHAAGEVLNPTSKGVCVSPVKNRFLTSRVRLRLLQ